MNRKMKIIAGVQIAALGLLAASALGFSSTLASSAHGAHSQGAGTVQALSSNIQFTHKPFKSH